MIPKSMNHRQLVGRLGEDETARRYAEQGFSVVARNLHLSHNEIDLILENETHLVFVEVKTRYAVPGERSRYGRPASAIDKAKRDRMRKAAQDYLRENPTDKQPRIDVSEVYLGKRADGSAAILDVKIFPAAYAGR